MNIGQSDQQAGDHLVLVVAHQTVAETALAAAKRATDQRDADLLRSHRPLGQPSACRSTPMIRVAVKRLFFIGISSSNLPRKIYVRLP